MTTRILAVRIPYLLGMLYRKRANLPAKQPLLVANTRTVLACCPLAGAQGIQAGMPLRQAQTLLPKHVLVRPDPGFEAEALQVLLTQISEMTALVEYATGEHSKHRYPAQSSLFFLDLEKLRHADALKLERAVRRVLAEALGYNGSGSDTILTGLGPNRFTAYVASCVKEDAQRLADRQAWGTVAAFLVPLPIDLLPLESALSRRLHLLGLTTLGRFAALPVEAIYRQFGKQGVFLHQLASGFDPRRIEPFHPQIVEQVRYETAEYPITLRTVFEAALGALSADLSTRLQARGLMGRTLRLSVTFANGKRRERKLTMQREISGAVFIEKALRLLSEDLLSESRGMTHIEVTLTDLVAFAGYQLDLFDHRGEQWQRVTQAVEKLSARYGREAFTRPVEVDRQARLLERRYQFQPFLTL